MDIIKGLVEISNKIRYKIHATERSRENYGIVVSKTHLSEYDAFITIYSSGIVSIESPKVSVEYNLATGKILCS